MGLYNFDLFFAAGIQSGRIKQTIRKPRPHPDYKGSTIHCYTGLRTKRAKCIGRFECLSVEPIQIRNRDVRLAGTYLDTAEKELLAQHDGFDSFSDFLTYWEDRRPFNGVLIRWR
jgi:hypothetical protein